MGIMVIYRIFNILVGVLGLAVGLGIIMAPNVISRIEKALDKSFDTDKLEKILNENRNLSEALMRHPKAFGIALGLISFCLLLAGVFV